MCIDQKDEKRTLFWCEMLHPVICGEVEASKVQDFLRELSEKEMVFPDGEVRKPSLSTLRRKMNRFLQGGFNVLARKKRKERGSPRNASPEIVEKAVELKKEQPSRSSRTIKRLLEDLHGSSIPRSTLYRHLKNTNATRLKPYVLKAKVKDCTMDHTHVLCVEDFKKGPHVRLGQEILPTYLWAFIDCNSGFIVEVHYYLRPSLDILDDSVLRAPAKHGTSPALYMDNAKVRSEQH